MYFKSVVHENCVPVPPSLCIRYTPQPNDFLISVKAQSRILAHALSRVKTGQLAYMTTTGQNASDENKGASAGCGEFTLYARTKRDGTTKYKTIKTTVEFSSARPVPRDGNHCEKQLRQLLTSSSVQGWRLRTRPGLCTRMKKRDK